MPMQTWGGRAQPREESLAAMEAADGAGRMLTLQNMHALRTLFNIAHRLDQVLGRPEFWFAKDLSHLDAHPQSSKVEDALCRPWEAELGPPAERRLLGCYGSCRRGRARAHAQEHACAAHALQHSPQAASSAGQLLDSDAGEPQLPGSHPQLSQDHNAGEPTTFRGRPHSRAASLLQCSGKPARQT